MNSNLYRIEGSWPGKLLLSARPRGGDWLEDEVAAWRRRDIDTVVSLLTEEEERELELRNEALQARSQGVTFVSYPITDRGVPPDTSGLLDLLERIYSDLQAGKNVLVHCRQGIGRTGLVAASLLVRNGMKPESAIEQVSRVRGLAVPETPEQESYIYEVAASVR